MANGFNKQEVVAFENILEKFNDNEVLSKAVRQYKTDSVTMARSNDTIWRPYPYILPSYDGMDQSANFKDNTQLAVPATLGFYKSAPWYLTELELRDQLQEQRLGDAARQKIASDINRAILTVAGYQGTIVIKRTSAATGFDDIAQCDSAMSRVGVQPYDRYMAISPSDYNNMASNLAGRQTVAGKVLTAYEQAQIGQVSGFNAFKLDYSLILPAAAGGGGLTISTLAAGGNLYTPIAYQVAATGQGGNVDNRFQTVTVSSTTNVAAGDCFTIANVFEAHHVTKQNTGVLKTFRVISVNSSTTMTISPPIIPAQTGVQSTIQYQNVVITTAASNASIVFLNTVAGYINPFWQADALEILPGRIAMPSDAGLAVMRGTTDSGIELTMMKQADINTGKIKYRLDSLFGVVNKQPEMSGIELFSQT